MSPAATLSHCPACGCDIRPDVPAPTIGRLSFSETGRAVFDGRQLDVARAPHEIMLALAKAAPRTLSPHILAKAIGTRSINPHDLVKVQVTRLRAALREAGISPNAIVTERHAGYRLDAERLA